MTLDEIRRAARRFGVKRAARNVEAIRAAARRMDTRATWRTAEAGAQRLRDAGLQDVRIEQLPADGRTSVNGWIMPIAWDIEAARLEAVSGSSGGVVLADYSRTPRSIAMYSPPTPRGQWVAGPVIRTTNPMQLGERLRGSFVFLPEGNASFAVNEYAARHGALAILTVSDSPNPDATRYLNYAVPLDASRRCIPCFSLAQTAARILERCGGGEAAPHLRARVRSRRYAGTTPMLTGTVGAGEPAIYVCGHIDEIGAQDNASGCGVAIEALRVLQRLQRAAGFAQQRRAIRFFFATQVRGQQGWAAEQARRPEFLGGLNLDIVGGDPGRESLSMVIGTGFSHAPHFAAHVLRDAVRLANREAGPLPGEEGSDLVGDAVPGLTPGVGHVSLQQLRSPTSPSSADTPAILSDHILLWSGIAATAFLYRFSRMDSRDAARLATRIYARAVAAKPGRRGSVCLRAAVAELKSLQPLLRRPAMMDRAVTPEQLYRAGVSRRTGLWPEVQRAQKVKQQVADLEQRLARRRPVRVEGAARALKAADQMVPLAMEPGFLSFEDHVTPAAHRRLKRRLGLTPGWGTPRWAWTVTALARGKRTLREILEDLARWGLTIDPRRAVSLVQHLVDTGRMRLRPILGQADIVRALKAVGVRQGSTVVAHTSLSRYGYVRGGPATVVAALRNALGPQGTLAMPTHSTGVLGDVPYDPALSPAITGCIPDYFRSLRGVRRSVHPTHSVAVQGPAADELLAGVRMDQAALARDGFWGRLCDRDGYVLLMCPPGNATILHAGEAWLEIPQAPVVVHARTGSGRRRVCVNPNGPHHVDHFAAISATLTRRGIMPAATLGEEVIRLAPARAMADLSVKANRRDPLVSLGKNGRCTCSYCRLLRDGVRASTAEE